MGGDATRVARDVAELAARYLVHEGLGVAEAAYPLGFSGPSAFHRAFKRWTGKTPLEYKRESG